MPERDRERSTGEPEGSVDALVVAVDALSPIDRALFTAELRRALEESGDDVRRWLRRAVGTARLKRLLGDPTAVAWQAVAEQLLQRARRR